MNIIHNVSILDKSGSMKGEKYTAAVKGLQYEIEELKKDPNAFYTQTIIEFSTSFQGHLEKVEHCFLVPLKNIHSFKGFGAEGGTPLYQVVGEVIEKLLSFVNKGEKVILKIFTDGEELNSKGKYANPTELKKLIDRVQEENGFIVTFEGGKFTGEKMRGVGVNVDNMIFHNDTAESFATNVKHRVDATIAYSAAVSRGEESQFMEKGFYQNIDKKD